MSELCSLHTCSGLRFFSSKASDPTLSDASVLVQYILTGLAELVVNLVKIQTQVGKV